MRKQCRVLEVGFSQNSFIRAASGEDRGGHEGLEKPFLGALMLSFLRPADKVLLRARALLGYWHIHKPSNYHGS